MPKGNFFYYLNLFLRAKFKFKPPPVKDIVIFDHGADQLEFLNKNKCFVFHTRGETVTNFTFATWLTTTVCHATQKATVDYLVMTPAGCMRWHADQPCTAPISYAATHQIHPASSHPLQC